MFKVAKRRIVTTLFFVAVLSCAFALGASSSYTDTLHNQPDEMIPWAYLPLVHGGPEPAVIEITFIYIPSSLPKAREYVQIENHGGSPQEMTGWKLTDEGPDHTYIFPTFTLQPGAIVKLFSRVGYDSDDELYWNDDSPFRIWDGDHDTAYLYDDTGKLVDKYSY